MLFTPRYKTLSHKPSSYAALQILFALFLPIYLYATYISRTLVGAISGEGVALLPIYWLSLLILTPLALVDGAMFPFGCHVFATLTGSEVKAISRVYVYEAIDVGGASAIRVGFLVRLGVV